MWDNGKNCGKFAKVTLGDFCLGGDNSGVPGTDYCSGGSWVSDEFNGAYQTFLVADSCQDGNRWCRDDKYHTDLKTASLQNFLLNG